MSSESTGSIKADGTRISRGIGDLWSSEGPPDDAARNSKAVDDPVSMDIVGI